MYESGNFFGCRNDPRFPPAPPHIRATRPLATTLTIKNRIPVGRAELHVRTIDTYLFSLGPFTALHRVPTPAPHSSEHAPKHDRPQRQVARAKIWGHKRREVRLADSGEYCPVRHRFSRPLSQNRAQNCLLCVKFFAATTWIDISSPSSARHVLVPPKLWAPPTCSSAPHPKLSAVLRRPHRRPCSLAQRRH